MPTILIVAEPSRQADLALRARRPREKTVQKRQILRTICGTLLYVVKFLMSLQTSRLHLFLTRTEVSDRFVAI
jgi:hypothetical protein